MTKSGSTGWLDGSQKSDAYAALKPSHDSTRRKAVTPDETQLLSPSQVYLFEYSPQAKVLNKGQMSVSSHCGIFMFAFVPQLCVA